MDQADIDELKREAEEWKTRWGAPMPAGQSQAFATGMLKLIAFTEETVKEQAKIRELVKLLDEVFFNKDGDPDWSKFMAAEKAYRKFRGKDD